jgi:hypothetical protein
VTDSENERIQTAKRWLQSLLRGTPDSALIIPNFEYEQHYGFTAGLYIGEEGLERWLETFYEVWDRASVDFSEDVREVANRIALDARIHAQARQSGIEVELRVTGVYEFARDGRLTRVDAFNDGSAAAEWLAQERG